MPLRKSLAHTKSADLAHIRSENIGRLLVLSFRRFEEIMIERMRFHRFADLRLAHIALIRNVDAKGTRLTEIAARAGMHKQAIGQLAAEVERLGYTRRTTDPRDGRAVLIQFTTKGKALLDVLPQIHEETHQVLAEIIGKQGIAKLAELLMPIVAEQRRRGKSKRLRSYDRTEAPDPAPSARGKRTARKPRAGRQGRSSRPELSPI